jgi:hypothetical protein
VVEKSSFLRSFLDFLVTALGLDVDTAVDDIVADVVIVNPVALRSCCQSWSCTRGRGRPRHDARHTVRLPSVNVSTRYYPFCPRPRNTRGSANAAAEHRVHFRLQRRNLQDGNSSMRHSELPLPFYRPVQEWISIRRSTRPKSREKRNLTAPAVRTW